MAVFSADDGGQGGLLSAFFCNGGDMDMLNSAFLKGMEEANKFLPTNNTLLEATPRQGARLHRQEAGPVLTFWGPGAQLNLGALNINKSMYFQKYFESLVKGNTICFSFFFTICSTKSRQTQCTSFAHTSPILSLLFCLCMGISDSALTEA